MAPSSGSSKLRIGRHGQIQWTRTTASSPSNRRCIWMIQGVEGGIIHVSVTPWTARIGHCAIVASPGVRSSSRVTHFRLLLLHDCSAKLHGLLLLDWRVPSDVPV
jgi:hypothetical protein